MTDKELQDPNWPSDAPKKFPRWIVFLPALLPLFALIWNFEVKNNPNPFSFMTRPLAAYADTPDLIIYQCRNSGEARKLCSRRADGSDYQFYDHVVDIDSSMSINSSGQIAFGCYDPSLESALDDRGHVRLDYGEICVINIDGTGFRQLTNNHTGDSHPSIDDSGRIVYQCEDESIADYLESGRICFVKFDGSDSFRFEHINESAGSPQMVGEDTIVYLCNIQHRSSDICVITLDGTRSEPIESALIDSFKASFAVNENGQIAYQCGWVAFCTINIDGTDYRKFEVETYYEHTPAINNRGIMAFGCGELNVYHLCIVDTINSPETILEYEQPAIGNEKWNIRTISISDNNIIALNCHVMRRSFSHTCLMRTDGSDFAILTRGVRNGYRSAIQ